MFFNAAQLPLDASLQTLVSLVAQDIENSFNWPGDTATAKVYASSEEGVKQPAWRFGELEISGSGSMPQLEGFSRHLVLLEGEGLLVMHDNHDRTEVLEQGENGAMDLAYANEVELIEGPVRLLDIVVDSKQYSTTAFILGGDENMGSVSAELLLVYGLEGERMHCIIEEHEFSLGAKQCMRIDHPPSSEIQCTDGRVLVLAIQAL